MAHHFTFLARDESDTGRFGAALARVLPPGTVVALNGTLGAGKTRLVQAVAKAVGIDPRDVVSPTFVLVHEYAVPNGKPVPTIYHFDAYRIKDDDEFLQLGPEEYFESDGWTFIEWAERVERCLPRDHLKLELDVTGATERRLRLAAHGDQAVRVIEAIEAAL